MSIESLKNYVFTSKYSRYIPEKMRRETFEEAVDRVIAMHRSHFAAKGIELEDLLSLCEQAMKKRMVLGSQRAMQFGGPPILRKNARIYNCTTSYCDRPRFFQEALWLLLCGCGVGFSVQPHHIDKLPGIRKPAAGHATFIIPDTIEGWADALGVLLSSYFTDAQPFPEYAGQIVQFDYTEIRPKGRPISSGMGRAPGPEPLRRSLEMIRTLVDRRIEEGHGRLRSVDAYDILMHASDAVLSGGVRRSATICLFAPDDELMATAKTGNWFNENPQRARSNNSAVLLRNQTTREQFNRLMKSVKEFGEPGFVWTDHLDMTFNPCGEIGLYPQIDGVTGFAFCNLCEINMGLVDNADKFREACRAAAILGTLQADYTDFEYLGEVSTRIAKREALLGISMTGMMENPDVSFDPQLQRDMAKVILEVNAEVAARIGINPAARTTCVKPAGTTSSILGTSSG
ncbi:MAG TPA: recombinase, partial [Kiritimatiellia bacterium]|nr:recombinase [Kiritimatiellia bacterium]